MQQIPTQEQPQSQVEYASVGMRFAAVVIDTVLVYVLMSMVWGVVLALRQPIDPQDPAAVQTLIEDLQASMGSFYLIFFCSLFGYYVLFEALFGATVGKLLLSMRVVMADGRRVTGVGVVVRNLVRVPEALLLYVPAGISCLSSPRCQRLGDHAARTVVVRRRTARPAQAYAAPGQTPGPAWPAAPSTPVPPPPTAPGAAWPPVAPAAPAAAEPPASLETELARLKTAALAARGAHFTYLRFSERELAADSTEQGGGYSDGYVSAWYTLTDAVQALKDAASALGTAASAAGQTPAQAVAGQPDLVHLLGELAPYLQASGDDAIHAAFLEVARAEASPS
jgi:uncharacterized RDD family membrane protein YckC